MKIYNGKDIYRLKVVSDNTEKLKEKSEKALKKMLKISGICLIFMIIEIIGGYISQSLAILSDAAHLLSDISGFLISIISIYISRKIANDKYTFGYHRAEVIGALVSVILIWILTGFLLQEAYFRIISPPEVNAPIMLLTSIFGLICNLIMIKVLHSGHGHGNCSGHGHTHSHNHSHSHNNYSGK